MSEGIGPDMEQLKFATSEKFIRWAKQIVMDKYKSYNRIPVGKQTWTYGDGHVVESEIGKYGGTMLANLALIVRTGTGDLAVC